MSTAAINKASRELCERADALLLIPRLDTLETFVTETLDAYGWAPDSKRIDRQAAPIWAEKLRHTYAKTLEIKYPEYAAANGDVCPIDSSVPPWALEYEYFLIDHTAWADWIDEDGDMMMGSAVTAQRFTGRCAEFGSNWDLNIFDLERAAAVGLALQPIKQASAKRAHDAWRNWVWLFGDSRKALVGLMTHPNIVKTRAPLNAGASSRLWANKTNAEILADLDLLIDSVPENTLEAYHVATVLMPPALMRLLRNRKLGTGSTLIDGSMTTLWDYIVNKYSGDATGQGKIEFKMLNECDADRRKHPKTNTDDSGLSGDFLLALPPKNKDEVAFISARPFTQRPPEEEGFKITVLTHEKIGGCKITQPLAVHRLDFGTT